MAIRFFAVVALLCAFLAAPMSVRADAFFSVLEDIPVMEGLVEDENAAVTFETATGRLAEAQARGAVSPDKVLAFYAAVLPQLGWESLNDGVFRRDAERLSVVVTPIETGGSALSLSLSPAKQ